MYAGVATYKLRPGKKMEATRIWEESFFPAAQQQRGFQAALWLVAPDMDKAIGIELWDIEVAASSFETSGLFHQLASKFQAVLAGPPIREQYHATGSLVTTLETRDQQRGNREKGLREVTPHGTGFKILCS